MGANVRLEEKERRFGQRSLCEGVFTGKGRCFD